MNKQKKVERYNQIRDNWSFLSDAKDDAMQALIRMGKRMGKLRYLMMAVLFLFLFVLL